MIDKYSNDFTGLYQPHTDDYVFSLASLDDGYFASGSRDTKVKIWSATDNWW